MTAKKFLSLAAYYSEAAKIMESKMYLRGRDQTRGRVQSGYTDRLAEDIEKLTQLKETYYKEVHRRVKMISALENTTYSKLLLWRYIDGDTWNQIATRLGYALETIINYHGYALKAFEKKYADILAVEKAFYAA